MSLARLWKLFTGAPQAPANAQRPRLVVQGAQGNLRGNTAGLVVPATWDEQEITRQLRLQSPQASPSMLIYYFGRLKHRFLLNQDHRTALVRIRFLEQKVSELKLTRDMQGVLNDLSALALEREVRLRKLELERLELDSKIQNHSRLGRLQLDRDRLQLEYEVALLKRKIREEDSAGEQKLTPAQQRALKKAELEEQLQRLNTEQARALQQATTELEKRRLQNMYAGRRDQLMARLEEVL